MKTYKATGIVCSNTKLAEADKIISVYSDVGLIRGVAKGVRKTKSKFGARLEPLSYINLVMYKGKNLDTVTQVELIKPFNKIRTNLKLLSTALTMTSFIEKTSEHESHPGEMLDIIVEGVESLENGISPDVALLSFWANSLSTLGYIFHLDCCVRCGNELDSVSLFGVDSGGFLCRKCSSLDEWTIDLYSKSVSLLNNLINKKPINDFDSESITKISKIFDAFIKYHLDINLKSYKFFSNL